MNAPSLLELVSCADKASVFTEKLLRASTNAQAVLAKVLEKKRTDRELAAQERLSADIEKLTELSTAMRKVEIEFNVQRKKLEKEAGKFLQRIESVANGRGIPQDSDAEAKSDIQDE